MILLCLNGVFFTFLNHRIADAWLAPQTHLPLLLWGAFVSAASILVCLPIVAGLNRWLPQLVGRPQARGPWLPPFA